jgi:hypothetical protein
MQEQDTIPAPANGLFLTFLWSSLRLPCVSFEWF